MSNNKKSFLLHIDSLDILDELTDDEAGLLFKAIRGHQRGDDLDLHGLVRVAFSPFRNQFNRDDEKYNLTCERRALAGSKGGKQKVANASKSKQKVANLADSVSKSKNDSKNDSDSKSDNDKDSDKHKQLDLLAQSKIERDNLVQDSFVYFWSNMKMRKSGDKKKALSYFKNGCGKLNPLEFARKLVTDTKTRFDNQQFGFDRMLPTSYLNGKRWEDDHCVDKQQTKQQSISDRNRESMNAFLAQGDGNGN